MSNPHTIDITRFRMNSHSSIDHYESLEEQDQNANYRKDSKNIPLILKKMNSVEKYVNQFKVTEMIQKQYRPKRQESPLYDPNLSTSKHLEKIYSHTSQIKLKQEQLKILDQKCYVKYASTSAHQTGKKNQVLDLVQNQYVKLKHSIHSTAITDNHPSKTPQIRTHYVHSQHKSVGSQQKDHSHPHQSFVNTKSISLLNKKKKKENHPDSQSLRINHKDVQKQLKTSVVEQNGKKYFADLYLMKRQRDKMLKEIFGANQKQNNNSKLKQSSNQQLNNNVSNASGKMLPTGQGYISRNASNRTNKTGVSLQKSVKLLNQKQSHKRFPKLKINLSQIPSTPYQQKMRNQEQSFVQQKILKDRSQKKQKMLKGRNMNWNVYYEMLALNKNQKDKLKSYCKFTQMYGED